MENLLAINLIKARQSRGITMEELAKRINCSKQTISNYENGLRYPDSSTLLSLADALGVDLNYFFTELNVSLSLNRINYREGNTLQKEAKKIIEEKSQRALNSYLELEAIIKDFPQFINPVDDLIVTNKHDAEKAAKQLRKKWKLGDGPISNISNLLERKGIRILTLDFGYNFNHEGLSGWAEDDKIPVIVLNARPQDITRIRFTILHELGHLLLEISEELNEELIERICDTFASAVLLPTEILVEEFGKNRKAISMAELRRIKELYGISISAIMVRALFTKLIDHNAYNKWKLSDYSDQDFGQFAGNEEPQKFNQMLYRALAERKIGFDKAASLAQRDEFEFQEIYNQTISF